MATVSLSANSRDSRQGRRPHASQQGQIPAVIYGHGREPQSLAINARELEKLLSAHLGREHGHRARRRRTAPRKTLIREIQRHPFKRQILHVDFQELVAGEKVTVSIPIVLIGMPEGVRIDGGNSRSDDA